MDLERVKRRERLMERIRKLMIYETEDRLTPAEHHRLRTALDELGAVSPADLIRSLRVAAWVVSESGNDPSEECSTNLARAEKVIKGMDPVEVLEILDCE